MVQLTDNGAVGEVAEVGDAVGDGPATKRPWRPPGPAPHVGPAETGDTAKRALDVVLGSLALVLVLPLAAVVALAVRLESPGPILRPVPRVGRRGAPFMLLKFRTGPIGSHDAGRRPPPVARVGRFVWYARLDELPRLLNVLRGDMSLVGPRPEPPEVVRARAVRLAGYERRHAVKPGLTGWAQVGSADEASAQLNHDLYYLEHRRMTLDLLILAKAARLVLLGEGPRRD